MGTISLILAIILVSSFIFRVTISYPTNTFNDVRDIELWDGQLTPDEEFDDNFAQQKRIIKKRGLFYLLDNSHLEWLKNFKIQGTCKIELTERTECGYTYYKKKCRNEENGRQSHCVHHGLNCTQRMKWDIVKLEEANCEFKEIKVADGCVCYPDHGMPR